jgi:deoxyribonuclease-4
MPQWLRELGLNAYEYQCNKGINLKDETAAEIGECCRENGIRLSIHAPYYINLSSTEKEKRERSVKYIVDTLSIAKVMGAGRIVMHSGYVSGVSRATAMEIAKDTFMNALEQTRELGLDGVTICPEVLGKTNQLGNIFEVAELCRLDEGLIPCIDFGHVHAMTKGGLFEKKQYVDVFRFVEQELGRERMRSLHIHFSRVETGKGGEKKHWTLADTQYGPEFEPLAEAILDMKIEPVIICESRDRMAEDAVLLKKMYETAAAKA